MHLALETFTLKKNKMNRVKSQVTTQMMMKESYERMMGMINQRSKDIGQLKKIVFFKTLSRNMKLKIGRK